MSYAGFLFSERIYSINMQFIWGALGVNIRCPKVCRDVLACMSHAPEIVDTEELGPYLCEGPLVRLGRA